MTVWIHYKTLPQLFQEQNQINDEKAEDATIKICIYRIKSTHPFLMYKFLSFYFILCQYIHHISTAQPNCIALHKVLNIWRYPIGYCSRAQFKVRPHYSQWTLSCNFVWTISYQILLRREKAQSTMMLKRISQFCTQLYSEGCLSYIKKHCSSQHQSHGLKVAFSAAVH